MHRQPLRDLCPRAVVVWRDGAARCDQCGRRVNRSSSSAPWAHVPDWLDDRLEELEDIVAGELNAELDRLLHPAEPTHRLEHGLALFGAGHLRLPPLDLPPLDLPRRLPVPSAEDAARLAFDLLRRGHNLPTVTVTEEP